MSRRCLVGLEADMFDLARLPNAGAALGLLPLAAQRPLSLDLVGDSKSDQAPFANR